MYDLLIFMGQSNMAGRGITCEKFPDPAPKLLAGAGFEYRAITAPDRLSELVEPFGQNENLDGGIHDRAMKTGSMVTALVNAYYLGNKKVPVLAVSASKGGSHVGEWQMDSKEGYLPDAINRLKACQAYAKEQKLLIRHCFMVWCQGETDADLATPKDVYFEKLRLIFDAMKAQGVEAIFTVQIGKCNLPGAYTRYDDMILWQEEFAEANEDVYLVEKSFQTMLERGLMKDGFHYYQQAYNEVGSKAGHAMGEVVCEIFENV